MNINLINFIFAAGTMLIQFFIIFFILLVIFKKTNKIMPFLKRNSIFFVFIISILGSVISLFYSEIIKIPPCNLCLIQRALLYLQILITGIAMILKWKKWCLYSLFLSVVGFGFALYQIILQFSNKTNVIHESTKCFGGSVDCSLINILEFGYITFPVISLTGFLIIIILSILNFKKIKA